MIQQPLSPIRSIPKRGKTRRGQTLVEYALILAVISGVVIATMVSTGAQVKGVFTNVTSQMASGTSSTSSGSGSGNSGTGGPTHGGGG